MLKSKSIKTLPRRALSFAIDFVLIPFYGEEENEGDTVSEEQTLHVGGEVLSQRGRLDGCNSVLAQRDRRSGGIRKLFVGKKSYSAQYTMHSKEKEATFQANIVVKYSKGKYDRKGVEYFAYAVYGMDIPVKRTYKEYRKRFGIESSHKLMNTARARTSSKNPVLRLLYVGIGFLLMNIWIC